ncbi:MAG TPA: glycoside hydrolase family 43 protein [Candidatus Angelobacter sp.]|nr:glycoside hydrolase family 43 protein [Candidatus Angelobacter sp.]
MMSFRAKPARCAGSLLIFTFALALCCAFGSSAAGAEFLPGEIWNDTAGQPINAHGGGILYYKGVYYWYGESKSGSTFLPESNKSWGGTRVDITGVSCYSSTNLYDWKNEGLVLRAETNSPLSDLYPSKVLERPKVIYNRSTKEFVMWMHIDTPDYAAARTGVALSEKPTGPFRYLGSFRPNAGVWPENVTDADKIPGPTNSLARDFKTGQMARDLTVFEDDDGQAYLFYASEDNFTMHVSLLTADYLHTTGKYDRIFINRSMEAPAVFKCDGKYYFIGSGCTGWEPNAARLAVADSIFGPWRELPNPCVGEHADTTFGTQSAFVLPIQGREDFFVFLADRWNQWKLPESRYVWLPLEFSSTGHFTLRWHNSWQLPTDAKNLRAAAAN